MKLPGPDHPITLTPNPRRVRVSVGDHVIVDTIEALTLQESTYPAVQYLPRKDVEMGFFGKTTRSTHCPYKGDASYYTLSIDSTLLENVLWSYEAPFPAMEQIREYVAFYTDKVKLYEVDPDV